MIAVTSQKVVDLALLVLLGAGWLFNIGLISIVRDVVRRRRG